MLPRFSFYIKVQKLKVLLIESYIWAKLQHKYKVIIYNDNTNVFNSFSNLILYSSGNQTLS